MTGSNLAIVACILVGLAGAGQAQVSDRVIGGDLFTSGETGATLQVPRDVLAAGTTVSLSGAVAQDTHAAGFAVDVDASTGGDLFAAGFSVSLRGPVAGDVTAAGFSVRMARQADVAGNVRLAGARVTVDGPVRGALAAAAGKLTLNADVSGDAALVGDTITFGPDARIAGSLTYSAPQQIDIPERVIPADRVTYTPYQPSQVMNDAREMWADWEYPVRPTVLTFMSGFLVTLAFFALIGALCLTLMPNQVRHLRRSIDARPGMALLSGVLGLSMLFGLVLVSALTVIGIPLIPIVLLVTLTAWILGYVLGAYVLAMRAMRGLGAAENPAIWTRLLALVVGVTLAALLNFIPVLGWMANFALVLLGIGGMTTAIFDRIVGNMGPALDVDMKPITPDQT